MHAIDLSPDLIVRNGRIYTLDATGSIASALAVKAGRIVAVGEDTAIGSLAGPHTSMVDLAGRIAIPGIFDSHNHLMEVGAKLADIRLDECQSPEEMMELVRQRASETPPGEWIVGQGWNEGNFPGGRLPTRQDIDQATRDHPVLLMRFFNTDLANSVALRRAGIDRHTPDPESGRIERDRDGEPNGLLRASAKTWCVPGSPTDPGADEARCGWRAPRCTGLASPASSTRASTRGRSTPTNPSTKTASCQCEST